MKFHFSSLLPAVVLVIMVISCGPAKNTHHPSAEMTQPELLVHQGACFGHCPVFSLAIFDQGDYMLVNNQFTDKVGIFSGKMDEATYTSLMKDAENLEWATFEPQYKSEIPDLSPIRLQRHQYTTVFRENAPEGLMDFSQKMLKAAKTLEPENTLYRSPKDHLVPFKLIISLDPGCTLDKDFQTRWATAIRHISPLDSEGRQYEITPDTYVQDLAITYYNLSKDPCISKIEFKD